MRAALFLVLGACAHGARPSGALGVVSAGVSPGGVSAELDASTPRSSARGPEPGGLRPTSERVIRSALERWGYTVGEDTDGDLRLTLATPKGREVKAVLLFNRLNREAKQLWKLQLWAQFAVKPAHYVELLTFVNRWNVERALPKLSLADRTTLRMSMNYPVQYGFNAREFRENVLGMFRQTMDRALDGASLWLD